MSVQTSTLLGLIRDVVVAIIGILILAGADISNDMIAGILLLVSTVFALGSWIYAQYKQPKSSAPTTVAKPK